jgi:hypothetical protein
MKATTVKRIMDDLTQQANSDEDGLHLNIDGQGFTNHFIICGDTDWTVDTDECLLTLESQNGTEFIDTDSIERITI